MSVNLTVNADGNEYKLPAQEKKQTSGGTESMVSKAIASVRSTTTVTVNGKTYAIPHNEIARLEAQNKLPAGTIVRHFREYEQKASGSGASVSSPLLEKEVEISVSTARQQTTAGLAAEKKLESQKTALKERLQLFSNFSTTGIEKNMGTELAKQDVKITYASDDEGYRTLDVRIRNCDKKTKEQFDSAIGAQLNEIRDAPDVLKEQVINRFANAASPDLKALLHCIMKYSADEGWSDGLETIMMGLESLPEQTRRSLEVAFRPPQ